MNGFMMPQRRSLTQATAGLAGALQQIRERQAIARQQADAQRKQQAIGGILKKYTDPKTGQPDFSKAFQEVYAIDPETAYKIQEMGVKQQRERVGADAPSSVREWQYYQTLNKDQKKNYLEMKRSTGGRFTEVGGAKGFATPGAAGESPRFTPLSTLEEEVEAKEKMTQRDYELKQKEQSLKAQEMNFKMDKGIYEFEKNKADNLVKYETFKNKNKNRIEELQEFSNVALRLADNPALKGITGPGKIGKIFPGTKWADADTDRQLLIAKSAIQSMEKLKAESPTGATGFGSMQANELKIIIDNFATLENTNQSPKKMRQTLIKIHDKINKWIDRQKAFEEKVGYIRGVGKQPAQQPTQQPSQPQQQGWSDEKERRYQELMRKKQQGALQ